LSQPGAYKRTPVLIVHREANVRKDVYGSIDDAIVLQGQLMRGEAPSGTVLVVMHPVGSPAYLPIFAQLAREGHHILACGTRYWNGDASLQMENVLVDLAACVRHAREKLGYAKIVLLGWSGGGSIMAGYQAEAERRVITRTAAGEETPLASTELIGADALMLVASHRSRHHLLTGQLDASILDERTPHIRSSALNLYDSENPARPPYAADFVQSYRAAQIARNRRISADVKERLHTLRSCGRAHDEHCFIVQGTMADPRWLDATLEPNGRRVNQTYLGDPRIVNDSPVALGRYTCLRSWLSQWSYDDAQVDSVDAAPRITVPSLIVTAGADDACPVSHTDAIFAALGSADKQASTIDSANHYFSGADGKKHLAAAAGLMTGWLQERGFAG
jgi:dienelactone hydrolase